MNSELNLYLNHGAGLYIFHRLCLGGILVVLLLSFSRVLRSGLEIKLTKSRWYIRKDNSLDQYNKSHLEKAGEYRGWNVVSIASKMIIAVSNE